MDDLVEVMQTSFAKVALLRGGPKAWKRMEPVHIPKRWRLLPADTEAARALAEEARIPLVIAQLLCHRGVTDAVQARHFLTLPLAALHDPHLLPGVTAAAERLHRAVKQQERICIYGDYDVDGIAGTTMLWRCLRLAGGTVDYYVPDRLEEGYGLNEEALRRLHEQGIRLVVTVDCGITSVHEAQVARELGLELIITDHHEIKDRLPEADILVHPRLPASQYPFPHLCGAGVAFKLAWAFCQQLSQARKVSEAFRAFLLESVALVALGTVADVVPLIDENRLFVWHGLRSLQEGPSIGLKALLDVTQLNSGKRLNAEHIGYTLAPRLNAAGRLGHARLAIELLGTPSAPRAVDLARYLNEQNERRQTVERRILASAREQVEAMGDWQDAPALVLADPEWHPGVIGIVASRLVDRFARPVLLAGGKEDVMSGSGRSVEGFPLHEALQACSEVLVSHGGHAMAAGFKVRADRLDDLRAAFTAFAAQPSKTLPKQHTLSIDAEIPLTALTMGLMKGLESLQPHGCGNRRPLFLTGGLRLAQEPKKVGGGERHLSFRVKHDTGPAFKAIAFGMADRLEELISAGGACCLVYTPKVNEWNGYTSIDLEIADFQPGSSARLD